MAQIVGVAGNSPELLAVRPTVFWTLGRQWARSIRCFVDVYGPVVATMQERFEQRLAAARDRETRARRHRLSNSRRTGAEPQRLSRRTIMTDQTRHQARPVAETRDMAVVISASPKTGSASSA
jgi:hypothetical protein